MWFRDDLRLGDNAALTWAAQRGPVVALFVVEEGIGDRGLGAAARWWQRRSVTRLGERLATLGVALLVAHGDPREVVPRVAAACGVDGVTWNRRYHKPFRDADAEIKTALAEQGYEVSSHAGWILTEPWMLQTASGGPYRVFTPFRKAAQQLLLDNPPGVHPVPALVGLDVPEEAAKQVGARRRDS